MPVRNKLPTLIRHAPTPRNEKVSSMSNNERTGSPVYFVNPAAHHLSPFNIAESTVPPIETQSQADLKNTAVDQIKSLITLLDNNILQEKLTISGYLITIVNALPHLQKTMLKQDKITIIKSNLMNTRDYIKKHEPQMNSYRYQPNYRNISSNSNNDIYQPNFNNISSNSNNNISSNPNYSNISSNPNYSNISNNEEFI